MADRDKINEAEIADAWLKVKGGKFQIFENDPFAPFDRLWKSSIGYRFVECRQRTSTWLDICQNMYGDKGGGVFLDVHKLDQIFIFVLRDSKMRIVYADIYAERAAILKSRPRFTQLDHNGIPHLTTTVPFEWFTFLA